MGKISSYENTGINYDRLKPKIGFSTAGKRLSNTSLAWVIADKVLSLLITLERGQRNYISIKLSNCVSYLNRYRHSSLNRMHFFLFLTFMTGLEYTLWLPKLGTYINLLLEHSRKYTTTSLGGSSRVDSAFIQLLFTDTHQGQNWSLHSNESLVPYLWKRGVWRTLFKLQTASLASEHLCCSVPMTIFIIFWPAADEFKSKGNSSCSHFLHIYSTGEGMTAW